VTILIALGALLAIGIIAAIVLAVRSASGTHYGHHGHRHR
jgi:hypothetical protein